MIPVEERLAARTKVQPPPHVAHLSPCMVWTGARNHARGGYGVIGRGAQGDGYVYTHRLAYELTHGEIPEGMEVCHHCDNPPCCNPAHLFLGDSQANSDDQVRKGRSLRGEKHKMVRLTEADVIGIRKLWDRGVAAKEIAGQFGTTHKNVSQIVRGKKWKHLLPDDWTPPPAGKWFR